MAQSPWAPVWLSTRISVWFSVADEPSQGRHRTPSEHGVEKSQSAERGPTRAPGQQRGHLPRRGTAEPVCWGARRTPSRHSGVPASCRTCQDSPCGCWPDPTGRGPVAGTAASVPATALLGSGASPTAGKCHLRLSGACRLAYGLPRWRPWRRGAWRGLQWHARSREARPLWNLGSITNAAPQRHGTTPQDPGPQTCRPCCFPEPHATAWVPCGPPASTALTRPLARHSCCPRAAHHPGISCGP